MNVAARAKAVLLDPPAAWRRIEKEADDLAFLLTRYIAPLALVPALSGLLGACAIGVIGPGGGTLRAPLFDAFLGAIFSYVAACAIVLALGLLINLLAPAFGAARNFENAFKLAVYAYTPVLIAGIFLLLPGLRFLTLTGFYGAYLLVVGLPLLMKAPAATTSAYAAIVVIGALALTVGAALAQHALFAPPGF